MSEPINPLDNFETYGYKHVLVAYKNTEDASKAEFGTNVGIEGEVINGCGPGVVVVNEFEGQKFFINNAEWDFNYYSCNSAMIGSGAGIIEVSERVGFSFFDFLTQDALPQLGDVNVSQAAFALRTFFVGSNFNSPPEVIVGNPYVFNVSSIVSAVKDNTVNENIHTMLCMSTSYSLGQTPALTNMYQVTLTHKDGNLHDEVPKPDPSACVGLVPRSQEDANKNQPRKTRLDKSKPMKTLEDIFDALQADLDQKKYAHKAQLQEWLRFVRDDHVDKIVVPPTQEKLPNAEFLPIDFIVSLDDEYKTYKVDNRNMPFEQPEQDQTIEGIRVFPFPPSITVVEAVNALLRLSTQIGDDAIMDKPKVPKISISVVRRCEGKYDVFIKIRRVDFPINSLSTDTGPGNALEPLHFFANDLDNNDRDVISIESKKVYITSGGLLEEQVNDPNAKVVYGNREAVTEERAKDIPFFETLYSGMRLMKGVFNTNGLESGEMGNELGTLSAKQFSIFDLTIKGNPYLLSDVNRRPLEVGDDDAGKAFYYQFPEYEPMYARLTIFQNTVDSFGRMPEKESNIKQKHYYDGFYHVSRVRNTFTSDEIGSGKRGFIQKLELRRSDDYM